MKKLLTLFSAFLFFTSYTAFGSEVEKPISDLVEGDTFFECQQDVCKEYVVKKKTTLGKLLKNSAKIVIPATALALIANIPTADGGPISAAACGTVCWLVSEVGCDAGTWIVATANPGVGILYGLVCRSMITSSTASCAAVCAALPSP